MRGERRVQQGFRGGNVGTRHFALAGRLQQEGLVAPVRRQHGEGMDRLLGRRVGGDAGVVEDAPGGRCRIATEPAGHGPARKCMDDRRACLTRRVRSLRLAGAAY